MEYAVYVYNMYEMFNKIILFDETRLSMAAAVTQDHYFIRIYTAAADTRIVITHSGAV